MRQMTEQPKLSTDELEFIGHILSRLPALQSSGAVQSFTAGPDHIFIKFPKDVNSNDSLISRIFKSKRSNE